jgi:hypothetical protein
MSLRGFKRSGNRGAEPQDHADPVSHGDLLEPRGVDRVSTIHELRLYERASFSSRNPPHSATVVDGSRRHGDNPAHAARKPGRQAVASPEPRKPARRADDHGRRPRARLQRANALARSRGASGRRLSDLRRARRGRAPRRLARRLWHPSQQVRDLPDGGLEISLSVADTIEVRRWLLGFGSDAEVLAPASLRETLRQEAERLAALLSRPRKPVAQLQGTPVAIGRKPPARVPATRVAGKPSAAGSAAGLKARRRPIIASRLKVDPRDP